MSAPYVPPSRDFIPLEEIVKRAPNLAYQLYFSAFKSNLEILAHVGIILFASYKDCLIIEGFFFFLVI